MIQNNKVFASEEEEYDEIASALDYNNDMVDIDYEAPLSEDEYDCIKQHVADKYNDPTAPPMDDKPEPFSEKHLKQMIPYFANTLDYTCIPHVKTSDDEEITGTSIITEDMIKDNHLLPIETHKKILLYCPVDQAEDVAFINECRQKAYDREVNHVKHDELSTAEHIQMLKGIMKQAIRLYPSYALTNNYLNLLAAEQRLKIDPDNHNAKHFIHRIESNMFII